MMTGLGAAGRIRAVVDVRRWMSVGIAGVFGLGNPLVATGVEQPFQSPRGAALGNAIIASIDDASAIHHNVAGLSKIRRPQIQLNALGFLGSNDYSGAAGANTTEDNFVPAASIFAAMPVADGFVLGLGVTAPNGLRINWGDPHPLRSLGYEGSLTNLRTTFGFGWQVTPTLEIGGAVVYARDEIGLTQGLIERGDGISYDGTGDEWGWTTGIRWEPFPGHRFAAAYRSKIDIETEGRVRTHSPTTLLASVPASLVFPYPQQIIVGYAWEPNDQWIFEFNWQYSGWSSVEAFVINLGPPEGGGGAIVQEQGWSDSQFYSFGVSYQCTKEIALRAGYLYGTQTVPDRGFGPLIPDAPLHAVSCGVGIERGNWAIDAALTVVWRDERNVRNSVSSPFDLSPDPVTSDGIWNSNAVVAFLGVTKSF
jgi:long-chain fatty acid transport protein